MSVQPNRKTTDTRSRLLARLPVTERHLEPAGIPTAVLEGGQGPPMVLLHGQGEFAATWMRVMPDLVAGHRVVAPDLPGHGASGVDGRLDRDRALGWLREVIAATCERPPVVVGHLLGGALAARLAVAEPEVLDRLVLVDTLGLRWYRPTLGFAAAMIAFVARPTPGTRDRIFDRCFVDLDRIREDMDGDMELLEAYALERAGTPELSAAMRGLMPAVGLPPIARDDLADLPVPTALIWGREDLQTPLRTAQRAAERFGWSLHVVDGAADDPAHERPGEFLRALRACLTGTAGAGR